MASEASGALGGEATDGTLAVPALLAIGLLVIGASTLRRFPYGHWTGLRTRATLSSPAAWEAAHVAAAPWMLAARSRRGHRLCSDGRRPPPAVVARAPQDSVAMGVEALFIVSATAVAQRVARRVEGR